ncbi:MAG TPA: cytochrome c [Solirubrobacteraceae bacterium]
MNRPFRVLCALGATVAIALAGAACGTQRISVPTSDTALHHGAVLFQERCAGCHSLSYAATFGSAANVFTAQFNNGPNFNVRCERPAIRVLYAIENGGFSGAIMPQNIVVGKDAHDVAKFVATYSGRQAPKLPNQTACQKQSIGSLPSATSTTTSTSTTSTTASTGSSGNSKSSAGKSGHHSSKKNHHS